MYEKILESIIDALPVLVALFIWAIRIEKKMTRIETNISWIREGCKGCQQTLEDPTP